MPCRIQRKRSKGWRMPAGAIYIGRPSKWGNPYWPGQSTDDFPMWLVGAYGKARLGPVGGMGARRRRRRTLRLLRDEAERLKRESRQKAVEPEDNMTAREYQLLAARTLIDAPDFQLTDEQVMIAWNVIGLAGEAGEVAETVKKGIFHL